MARKLTEEELYKVTGGANVVWGSSLSLGGGTLYTGAEMSTGSAYVTAAEASAGNAYYTGAEMSTKKAYLEGFESAVDKEIAVITPATEAEEFFKLR